MFMPYTMAVAGVSSTILVKESVSWDGGAFEYATKGKSEITVQRIEIIAGGEEVSLAVHCHTMPLAAYVLKGSVKVVMPSGENKVFMAGEAFIEVMNKWHKGIFVEDTELIVFYAGKENIALSANNDSSSPLSKYCK